MILLLGSNFLARAFVTELRRRHLAFVPLSADLLDFSRFDLLFDYLRHLRPSFIIHCDGFLNEDPAGALDQREALQKAVLLPETVARACGMTNTPWANLSSASIYAGARILGNEGFKMERNLAYPSAIAQFQRQPESFHGFAEHHPANLTFAESTCPLVSGVSALGEERIRNISNAYIWRLRLPFGEAPERWNLLHRLADIDKISDGINTVVHLGDAVRACLDLWTRRAPFGIYHIANPGPVTYRRVIERIQRVLKRRDPVRHFGEVDFTWNPANAPQGNCVLDTAKIQSLGIRLRSAESAIVESLNAWPVDVPENIAHVLFK
jgi:dTDP-4-dehydrorhamnose reductase